MWGTGGGGSGSCPVALEGGLGGGGGILEAGAMVKWDLDTACKVGADVGVCGGG